MNLSNQETKVVLSVSNDGNNNLRVISYSNIDPMLQWGRRSLLCCRSPKDLLTSSTFSTVEIFARRISYTGTVGTTFWVAWVVMTGYNRTDNTGPLLYCRYCTVPWNPAWCLVPDREEFHAIQFSILSQPVIRSVTATKNTAPNRNSNQFAFKIASASISSTLYCTDTEFTSCYNVSSLMIDFVAHRGATKLVPVSCNGLFSWQFVLHGLDTRAVLYCTVQ